MLCIGGKPSPKQKKGSKSPDKKNDDVAQGGLTGKRLNRFFFAKKVPSAGARRHSKHKPVNKLLSVLDITEQEKRV